MLAEACKGSAGRAEKVKCEGSADRAEKLERRNKELVQAPDVVSHNAF